MGLLSQRYVKIYIQFHFKKNTGLDGFPDMTGLLLSIKEPGSYLSMYRYSYTHFRALCAGFMELSLFFCDRPDTFTPNSEVERSPWVNLAG